MKQESHAVSKTSFISMTHDVGHLNSVSEIFAKIYMPADTCEEIVKAPSGYRAVSLTPLGYSDHTPRMIPPPP
ncbi:MAG: hypothetical protein QXD69_05465, partial [Candidatus Bathyarchaeia archaeon]